jgi:superfamily I DNA and/or RNA helicase
MDEAAQLAEAYFSIVLLPSVQRVFLIGDEKQLPAIMLSNDLNHRRFGRSLFERFARGNWPTQMLLVLYEPISETIVHLSEIQLLFSMQEQYRMHPEIALFPNLAFYQSKLLDSAYVMARDEPSWMKPPSSSSSSTSSPPNLFSRHMTLVNIKGFDGEQADALKSLYNKMEEDCVMALLRGLMRMMKQHRQQGAKYDNIFSIPAYF